jgi:alpha-galactosidase
MKCRLLLGCIFISTAFTFAQPVKTPIMGWSSWNSFRVKIDEKLIREQADAMISSGLYDAGYRYINIDDGYFGGRDSTGKLFVNPNNFPSGMKALTDYIL